MANDLIVMAIAVGLLTWLLFPLNKYFSSHRIRLVRILGSGSLAWLIVGAFSLAFLNSNTGLSAIILAICYLVGAAIRCQFSNAQHADADSSPA